jgi:HEAT repeat protein
MSISINCDRPSEPDGPKVGAKPPRRFQIGVRALIALVFCCGLVLWAWRVVRENLDPAIVEARGIQARAIRALHSPKAAERLSATVELSRLGFGDSGIAIRPLIARLEDENAEVRAAAADALGAISAKAAKSGSHDNDLRAAATALLRTLKDQRPAVRTAAANALGAFAGPRRAAGWLDLKAVVAALAEGLGDRDAQVRGAILRAIGSAAFNAAVGPPAEVVAALEDESADNGKEAGNALARFTRGLDPWIPSLFRGLERARPPVRDAYTHAFERIRPYWFGNRWLRPAAYSAAVIPTLVAALGSHDEQVRCEAVSLIGGLGPSARVAVPDVIAILREPINPEVRQFDVTQSAIAALGRNAPGTEAAEAVVAALTNIVLSGNPAQRYGAVAALGEFGPEAALAVPALLEVLKQEATASQRPAGAGQWASYVLGQIAPGTASAGAAITALTDLVRSGNPDTREVAADALGKFGPEAAAAVPALIKALRTIAASKAGSRDEWGVKSVCFALGRLAPGTASEDEAVTALIEALDSKSGDTRVWAIRTLPQFGPKAAGAIPRLRAFQKDRTPAISEAAASALKSLESAN